MNEDQEIRAKAIEINSAFIARLTAASIIAGRPAKWDLWSPDLKDIENYIRTGKR